MRPREQPPPPIPERLARFVASEWPGVEHPLWAWHSARFRHAVEHYPDGGLGDPVERMAEWREAKRKAAATSPIQPAQFIHPYLTEPQQEETEK